MILNQLVLHNIGTFAGRHPINLTPQSDERPIVLVGGLNGAGKTTILESIQLALYGSLVHASGRRTGSYENYLRSLIHRGVPASEGASVELTFTAFQEGQEHHYQVRRIWKSTGGSALREILDVSLDGRHHQSLTDTWAEHVETFLPRGIAGLFFFDGEQIEALADMDRSQQVLRSALDALLGLDLVERLGTDLSVLRRRHRGDQVSEESRREIEAQKEIVNALRRAEEAADANVRGRRDELERSEKQFFQATEAFRAAGGELLERREQSEAAVTRLKGERKAVEDEIRHQLAEYAPPLQLPQLLAQLAGQAKREATATRDSLLVEAFTARDALLMQRLHEAKAAKTTVAAVEKFLTNDRESRQISADTEVIVGPEDLGSVDLLISSTLPESRRRLRSLLAQRSALIGELDQAERVVAAIPDAEAVAALHDARDAARAAQYKAEVDFAVATEMLQKARSDVARAVDAYNAKVEKSAQDHLAADDDRRLIEHVDRVRETLQRLRVAATKRHLERISQLILEALEMLLRKDKLITDVQIDPETHAVRLTGADGHELPAKDLSAGERQLLAVALLWGLARAAGQPLPVVIDTPLGRLDGSHRGHLLDRYFPAASHQVILLSTDTEIDQDAYARIAPRVGRTYHLEFDSTTNATHVEDGYFWE